MSEVTTRDIVELLEEDHDVVKALLEEIDGAGPDARDELFWQLVPVLAAHEVVEERVVYPSIRGLRPDGETQAEERLQEQSEAEENLVRMEDMDRAGDEFATEMHALKLAVLDHAELEEENVFPMLEALEDRTKLGELYEKGKARATSISGRNGSVTSSVGKASGSVAALFEQAREATRKI